MMSLRVAMPDLLVDLSGLYELKEVSESPAGIRIGALVTHADVEDGKTPDIFGGLMRKVASGISYRAVRNYGTLGGSIALADPAADWPVCLIALGAVVQIAGGEKFAPSRSLASFKANTRHRSQSKRSSSVSTSRGRALRFVGDSTRSLARAAPSQIQSPSRRSRGGAALSSVVLGAAGSRPYQLRSTAERVGAAETSEDALRQAVIRRPEGC